MKIEVDDFLRNSLVLSVNNERLALFKKRFEDAGLTPVPRFFRGFTIPNGIQRYCGLIKSNNICNCGFSHIALMKAAQVAGMKFMGVFEDDALPCIGCREKLAEVLENIPDDADLVKFGSLGNMTEPTWTGGFFEKARSWGSHAYIVFEKYYDTFVDHCSADLRVDVRAMNNMDGNTSAIYQTSEMLFIQECSGFSDTLHNNSRFMRKMTERGDTANFELP